MIEYTNVGDTTKLSSRKDYLKNCSSWDLPKGEQYDLIKIHLLIQDRMNRNLMIDDTVLEEVKMFTLDEIRELV